MPTATKEPHPADQLEASGYTYVFASKGPLIGRPYVLIPNADVPSETGANGWAIKRTPPAEPAQ